MISSELASGQAWLQREYPQIASGFLPAQSPPDPALLTLGSEVYAQLLRKCAVGGTRIDAALEALVHMSVDFLRLQPVFMKTGRYAATGATGLYDRFYGNREVMQGYYLDGLLLSYAFWTNHARILAFFIDDFLAKLPRRGRLGEIGVGHGLMALAALRRMQEATYVGVDLSPFALTYAEALLRSNDVSMSRVRLMQGDATDRSAFDAPVDGVWCGEVLEHVDNPRAILAALRQAVAVDGRVMITTVANVEAEDHVYLFHDADEIRQMSNEAGFAIDTELALPIRGYEHATPRPLNYAAVLRPEGRA